jgi:hypothetical protein
VKALVRMLVSVLASGILAIVFLWSFFLVMAVLLGRFDLPSDLGWPIAGLFLLGFIAATTFSLSRIWRDS